LSTRKHSKTGSADAAGNIDSGQLLQSVVSNAPVIIWAYDVEGVITLSDGKGLEAMGVAPGELVGQSVLGVFHPEDHDGVRLQLERLLRDTQRVLRWRFRKIRKDGSELWVEEYGRTVESDDGAKRVLVVCHDITDRVLTERALADSEERFRAVVEQSRDCIFHCSPNRLSA